MLGNVRPHQIVVRLAPLALLVGYGIAFASSSIGFRLLVFDDHPGQFYRLWHAVTLGVAPWRWDPGWWMGYPELQFYPPGVAWIGTLLHVASFGRLPVDTNYQMLVWLAYLAPGITCHALLTRLLGSSWLALPGAFVALTLSAGVASGVEGGVHIGMLAARLAWALLPLLVLAVSDWLHSGRAPFGFAPPLIAAITLIHPAHLPAAVIVIILAAAHGATIRRRVAEAAIVLGLAGALTAVWTLPLVTRLHETRALAWGSLTTDGPLVHLVRDPLLIALVAFAGVAIRLARSSLEVLLARLPWLMAIVVAADALIAEPLGIRWLPADRVIDSAALAVVLAAGVTLARLLAMAAPRAPVGISSIACVIGLALLSLPAGSLALWPRAVDWPVLDDTRRGMQLSTMWSKLVVAPPGRVLFVRSSVPLVYGTAWYRPHSHIMAITPIVTGRPIINGTFTHPSPIAALVYRGPSGRGPITELVERLDGRSLFGQPLAQLDAVTFDRYADRLGVSVIVALEDDVPSLSALHDSRLFAPLPVTPPFVAFTRRAPVQLPRQVAPDRWRLEVKGSADRWLPTRVAYYPLWRAEDEGRPLPVRRGELGDLEVRPARDAAPITLVYRPAVPEIVGVVLSGLALIVWAALLDRSRLRARS